MFVPSINLGHDLTSLLPSLGGLNQIFPAIRFPSPGQASGPVFCALGGDGPG